MKVTHVTVLKEYPREADYEGSIIACFPTRILKTPRVPGTKTVCTECGEQVWLANSSPRGPRIICMPCAEELMQHAEAIGEDVELCCTERQMDEAKRKMT